MKEGDSVMEPEQRRQQILKFLQDIQSPFSGSTLASKLGVSRQVIVQDIALLRAEGKEIIATPQGYIMLLPKNNTLSKTIACCHNKEDIKDELTTIVDEGGTIIDVIVEHSIYGQISGNVMVSSRRDVDEFIKKIHKSDTKPLSDLTHGVHLHTIQVKDEQSIVQIEKELKGKGYLLA